VSDAGWVDSTQVMILLRTDKAAGGRGYAGLPSLFSAFLGKLIIIDDPATITALNTRRARGHRQPQQHTGQQTLPRSPRSKALLAAITPRRRFTADDGRRSTSA